jgi:hypothetical protein
MPPFYSRLPWAKIARSIIACRWHNPTQFHDLAWEVAARGGLVSIDFEGKVQVMLQAKR